MAIRTVIPRLIKPMLAQGGGTAFDNDEFGFEIKWDGLRALAISDGGFRLQNRHLRDITALFPDLVFDGLPDGTVLDGEVIVFKEQGPSFNALQKRSHTEPGHRAELAAKGNPATFAAFDILYDGGENVTALPLSERRARLERLGEAHPRERLLVTDQVIGRGKAYFEAAAERGLEGVIAKRLDAPYVEGKRTGYWSKVVAYRLEAFQVLGYVREPGTQQVRSIVVGQRQDGGWVRVGRVGGLDEREKPVLYKALKDAPPLSEPPEREPTGAIWRETALRCQVRYFPETVTGGLRLPRFKGWLGE